jgi:hypothetical protein
MICRGSLFNGAYLIVRLYSVDDTMISQWWWIGKDLVASGRDLIFKALPPAFAWRTEENHEKPQASRSPGPGTRNFPNTK